MTTKQRTSIANYLSIPEWPPQARTPDDKLFRVQRSRIRREWEYVDVYAKSAAEAKRRARQWVGWWDGGHEQEPWQVTSAKPLDDPAARLDKDRQP